MAVEKRTYVTCKHAVQHFHEWIGHTLVRRVYELHCNMAEATEMYVQELFTKKMTCLAAVSS
jgi:hypothetical protein